MDRDLGQMGESRLVDWAAQVGIVANKPQQDKTGWDCLLELPIRTFLADAHLPLDIAGSPIKCLVQVKATDGHPGRWDIKLDHWVSFVNCPIPAFFLVIEYDGLCDPQRAYLVHVGPDHMCAVLRRLRSLTSADSSSLHKHTLRFRYGDSDALPSLDGEGLLAAVSKHAGRDLPTYAEGKLRVLRDAGYEKERGRLSVLVALPPDTSDVNQLLVDFLLGLVPHLDVIRGEVRDMRFGIPALEPEHVFEHGRLEIKPEPVGDGTVVLHAPSRTNDVVLPMLVYVPRGLGPGLDLPPESLKALFRSPFIDLVVPRGPGSRITRFRCTFPDSNQEYGLKELSTFSQAMLALHEASEKRLPLHYDVWLGSTRLGRGVLQDGEQLQNELVGYLTAIRNAHIVAKHFDLQDSIQAKPGELAMQKSHLAGLALALSPIKSDVRVVIWSVKDAPQDSLPICYPFVVSAVIGQYRVAVSLAVIGQLQPTGLIENGEQEFQCVSRDVRVCREYLWDRSESPTISVESMIHEVIDSYGTTCHILRSST